MQRLLLLLWLLLDMFSKGVMDWKWTGIKGQWIVNNIFKESKGVIMVIRIKNQELFIIPEGQTPVVSS